MKIWTICSAYRTVARHGSQRDGGVRARRAEREGFTVAAAELGMPKSTVSRKVTELEARLKARLLNHTTRKVSLTDVGRTYYDHCARIVAEIEDAERAVTSLQELPRGVLRVTTQAERRFLGGPILNDYMKRYPEGAGCGLLHRPHRRPHRGSDSTSRSGRGRSATRR